MTTGTGPYANSNSWFGMALETVPGTAEAAPDIFIPVKDPKITPQFTQVTDDGLRGSMVDVFDQVQGVRHDEYGFTCMAYLDTLAALVHGCLGGVDTITGAATPYTHKIGLLNNDPSHGNQPPSYTLFDYDGYKLRSMAGAKIDELSIKFTATGLVEVTVKALTLPYTVLTGALPATSFSDVDAAPAWSCAASLAGTANSRITDGTIDLKRGVKAIHTLGQQAPFSLFAGPLSASGKLTVINSDDTEQNYLINDTAFAVGVTFSPPSADAGDSFGFTMSTVKAKSSVQSRGGDGMIVTDLDLQPLPNSTDATDGGVSPISFTAINAQSTGY